ncbi:MAG: acetate kinase [Endomicrobium sp.]|jgi:acetate kinase|nr:acetate kinase [Endomicrobium sp.]
MKVLTINCGSSSIKYSLFKIKNKEEKKIAGGIVECIGSKNSFYRKQFYDALDNTKELKMSLNIQNHNIAIKVILNDLLKNIIKDYKEINIVGHRIVHGGNKFSKSVLVTNEIKKFLKQSFSMAPLHNPANYSGILAVENTLPGIPSVLVFDTAFYHTIPDYAYMYALPYKYFIENKIRKYGFHGISHQYVSKKAAELIGMPLKKIKLITAHIGNGSSVTAIKYGKAIDTSMGFTPVEGIIMGTRCGNVDPSVLTYIMDLYPFYRNENNLNKLINKQSGLYGISEKYSDMRDIINAALKHNDHKSKLAIKMLCYSLKKYICSYYGILNGIHGLVFTAGIGENSPFIREMVCKDLYNLGISLNSKENTNYNGKECIISNKTSKTKILVIPTNEELMIAREAIKFL